MAQRNKLQELAARIRLVKEARGIVEYTFYRLTERSAERDYAYRHACERYHEARASLYGRKGGAA